MTQVSSYQPKTGAPGALAMVIALHAAGITALALWKIDVTRHVPQIIELIPISVPVEPDPIPPEPAPKAEIVPPKASQLSPVPPIVDVPRLNHGPAVEIADVPTRPVWFVPSQPLGDAPVPPPPAQGESAKARGDVRGLFTANDYPLAAIRRDESGQVRARLAIGADGRITGCSIAESSGSATLDQATCKILRSRARFTPARDSSGTPVSGSYVTPPISWQLVDRG